MQELNPSNIYTEYRDRVSKTSPVAGRKYTVTHSDTTGDIFVTIGKTYAKDKFGPTRDEVLLTFEQDGTSLTLYGSVLVDINGTHRSTKMRNEIFLREMPKALQAIRFADHALFEAYPKLDDIPIYIWFQSDSEQFNRVYPFDTMKDYKIG